MSAFSGSIDVSNIINELQDLIGKGSKTSVDELTKAIEQARKAVKALKEEQDGLNQSMAAMTERNEINNSLKQLQSGLEAVTKSLQRLREDATSTNKRLEELSMGKSGGSSGGNSSAWGDLETQLKNINLSSEELQKNFLDVKTTMDSGNNSTTIYNNGLDTTVKVYKRLTEEGEQYKVTLEKINQSNKNAASSAKYIESSNEALKRLGLTTEEVTDITNAMNNKGISSWNVARQSISANGDAVYELRNNLDKVVTVTQKNVDGTTQFSASLKNVTKNAKEASKEAGTWGYSWSRAWQSFLTYMSVTDIFFRVKNAIVDMIHEVEELDSALVELKKVTDLEGESLNKFIDEAYKAGATVAKTGTEMVEAATQFAKAGYDESQILQLGTIASMYTNIADEEVSAGQAAEFLIAQMKAFNIEADNAEHIIDAVNEVSNNFAVSSADIANNLGKSSAVMANAGNSMEQMIGLMTAGTEVTRNASKVANGLKTITLRLQGMNDEGERDLELQAQMEGMFNKLGISVYDANGELKNTYEIMETLASVYGDLTNAEKAYVTETIAGKFQAQNAAAILNNWKTAVEATETAMNSTGSAATENEKVLDSIEGHMQALSSSWENFARSIIDSDLIKFFVDMGNTILKIANSDFGHFIGQTMAVIAVMALLKGAYNGITNKISQMTVGLSKNTVALILNDTNLKKQDKDLQKTIKKLLLSKGAYDKETKTISQNTIEEIRNAMSKKGVAKSEQDKIIKGITSEKVTKSLTAATIAQTVAQEALNAALTMGISFLISGAVSLISGAINASKQAKEEAIQIEEELRDKAIETGDELNERNKSLDEYINQYKSLKQELSDESTGYARSAEIRSEIVDIQKEINDLLGEENGGIDLINDSLEETIKKQNELKRSSAKDYMAQNASAIKKAQDNLSKNYYNKSNRKIATEERYWNEWDWDESTADWMKKQDAMLQAMANSYGGTINYSSGWGGKDENHHGFDKESYIDLTTEMTAQEALEMWKGAYEELKNKKQQYITEYGLSDEDYDKIVETTNKNYTKVKEYIDKQNEVLDKAAESIIYSDDTYYQKITELQVAQAEYNKAKAEGNEKEMEDAISKMANLQKYVDGLKDDTVKNYFNNILKEWDNQIKQSNFGDKLADYFKSQGNELQNKLKSLEMDGDTFRNLFNAYLGGDKSGLDADTLKIFEELKTLMEEMGLSSEDLQSFLENLDYVLPGVVKKTKEAVDALGAMETRMKSLNENIDSIQGAYKTLSDAITEYNENGFLTLDTLQSILSLDDRYIQYLIDENGQLSLNKEAFERMANARLDEAEALAVQQAMEEMNILTAQSDQVEIEKLRKKYADLETELGNVSAKYNEVAAAALKFKATEGISQADKDLSDQIMKNLDNKLAVINKTRLGLGKNFNKTMGGSSSSSSSKEWWEQELDKLKNQFNYNEITIEQYINGLEGLLGKLDKGSEAWNKINQELQKQRLDKVKDDYNAGRISLSQYIKELEKLQKAYKEGTKGWKDLADAIKKAKLDELKDQQNDLKAALSAVNNELTLQINNYEDLKDKAVDAIDKEIDKQEELKDSIDDNIDDYERAQKAVLKYLNEQLDSLNNNRDSIENYFDTITESLENMNDEQERAVELAEAYENLVNAMSNKTKKVYKEGLGWVWEADQEAIKEARKTYEDLLKESQLKEIEDNKDKTLETLDSQIEALENYITSWDEVLDKFENEKNKNLADLLLGENWSEAVSQLDPNIVEDFSNAYYNLQKSLEETEAEIERLNKQKDETEKIWDEKIDKVKEYKDAWSDVTSALEDELDKEKANQLLAADWEKGILEQRINVLEDFKNKYNRILSEIDKVNGMSTDAVSNYTPYALPGYSNGGEVNFTGLAMLHGTPNKPEYVFNNDQIRNLLSNLTKPQYTSNMSNGNSVVNNYSIGNIELPNVQNSQQFINELKSLVNTSKNL